ncbi:MAG: hypothetical protein KI785_05020, partial [Devosiaceae bacterium]|nr:hypothetical protein [Devosiaceae bacterium MH13]
ADATLDFTATDLGSVTRDAILDASAGAAAFALAAPGATEVIEGRFGSLIMVVNAIGSEEPLPFEALEEALRFELARARAGDDLFSLYDAVEDARAAGDTLADIASRFDLELVSVPAVDSNGFDADTQPANLPPASDLIAEIFATDVGLENDIVETTDGGFVWFEVTSVEDARELTFEEAQDRVSADFRADQLDQRLRDRAEELVTDLERGRSLETLAIALEIPVSVTDPFTRGEAPDVLGGPATVAAYEGAEGHFGHVEGPGAATGSEASRLVFVVTDVTRPAFFATASDVQTLSEELGPALEDTILTQYVGGLQAELGVQVNQDLLNQLLAGRLGGARGGL